MKALRYLAVGLLGAAIGGYLVARATHALPTVMSQFMSRMMERMSPEQRERCREMMARFAGDGHGAEPIDATKTHPATPAA
jgi:hypothetical protein